jgi:hypothetical protein
VDSGELEELLERIEIPVAVQERVLLPDADGYGCRHGSPVSEYLDDLLR